MGFSCLSEGRNELNHSAVLCVDVFTIFGGGELERQLWNERSIAAG